MSMLAYIHHIYHAITHVKYKIVFLLILGIIRSTNAGYHRQSLFDYLYLFPILYIHMYVCISVSAC